MSQPASSSVVTVEIQAMVDTILRVARPLRIILFGSRAYGTAGIDSDADLLIVQSLTDAVHSSRWQELRRVRTALRNIPGAKDLLLYRPEEFETWRNSLNHVVGRAAREGIVLYERS